MADDTREKYINPYTDFGFKKLFGTEMNKDLLISFLNALLERRQYEASQKEYWDYTSTLETAELKGVQKEKIDTIHRLQAMGLSVEQIAQGAGLEVEKVKKLLQ